MEIHYRIKKETLKVVSPGYDEPEVIVRYYPMVNFYVHWYYLYWDDFSFTYTQNKQYALYRNTYEEALDAIAQYNSYWQYKENEEKPEPSEYNGVKYFYDEEIMDVDITQTVTTKGYTFPTNVGKQTKEILAKAYQRVVDEELQDCKEED